MSLIHCNLRVLMAEQELNIQNVKDKTTLSRTTISNLYNNIGSGIQFGTLLELCALLKCQPGDLLTYIEVLSDFEILTKNPDIYKETDIYTTDDDGNGHEYVSSIEVDLNMNCMLRYEGEYYVIYFETLITVSIDEKKNIDGLDFATTPHLEYKLYELKLPKPAEEYVFEKLENFILHWAVDYFYGEEIEDTTHMLINRSTLLR